MELEVLKKRLSTYKTEGGYLKNISDEIALEVLHAWEQWTGPAKGFSVAVGTNQYSLNNVIRKAKSLKRDGFATDGFKEVKITESNQAWAGGLPPCSGIEMCLENGKLIRFQQVDQLIDFLKKAA
jgi:hypothetical protein